MLQQYSLLAQPKYFTQIHECPMFMNNQTSIPEEASGRLPSLQNTEGISDIRSIPQHMMILLCQCFILFRRHNIIFLT
jgi:hypothetical protein